MMDQECHKCLPLPIRRRLIMKKLRKTKAHHLVFFLGLSLFGIIFLILPLFDGALVYSNDNSVPQIIKEGENKPVFTNMPSPLKPVIHVKTPNPLKAIYMTSWVAGTPSFREKLVKLIEETELNAVIIDIKDYTGKIAFLARDPNLFSYQSSENRVPDMDEFIGELHGKDIYVIGRIAVFQDDFLAREREDLAVKRASTGDIWLDRKKIAWLDMEAREVWDYTFLIAKEAERRGFDEINFDYIRFPSDGDTGDMSFPFYNPDEKSKAEAMKDFFIFLEEKKKELKVPISADLFGMVLTETNDLNIGQVLENALPYFDYVAPMIYPSHYPNGFNGWRNPATVPYELLTYVLDSGVNRAIDASTTPDKIRPWLQDFDLGANYTAEMIRAQKQAVYDSGLSSWMMWSPSNHYTRAALD